MPIRSRRSERSPLGQERRRRAPIDSRSAAYLGRFLPVFGQKYGFSRWYQVKLARMPDLDDLRELIDHLARTSRLTSADAERLANEVLTFLGETHEACIRR